MAYAINRAQVSELGEYGYEPAANQTDIVKPTFSSWYDSSRVQVRDGYTYDPSKAICILKTAGLQGEQRRLPDPKGPEAVLHDRSTSAGSPTGWPPCT